jgi:hypothetical protein
MQNSHTHLVTRHSAAQTKQTHIDMSHRTDPCLTLTDRPRCDRPAHMQDRVFYLYRWTNAVRM